MKDGAFCEILSKKIGSLGEREEWGKLGQYQGVVLMGSLEAALDSRVHLHASQRPLLASILSFQKVITAEFENFQYL